MNKTIIVLPSARAIRHEQLSIDSQILFLPNYMTMNDFISKLYLVPEYKTLDKDSRTLLLLEASDFKSFSSLKIQRNFFTFTKNSSYIFKFFEELSAEIYDISKLNTSDIYAEFEEHIAILQELYKRYENLCNERKVLDKIFLPKLYEFNKEYILNYDKVSIYIDGYLTNFELEILEKACKYIEVEFIFTTSRFNTKMQKKFLELGIELEVDFEYNISLNTKQILNKTKRNSDTKIICESFSESILQIAFVKQKVYEFVQKGYKAENIAVVLPDESMAAKLKSFDTKYNFNFAMGESLKHSEIYQKLNSVSQALDQKSSQNYARLTRLDFDNEIYLELLPIYHKNIDEVDIIEFLTRYKKQFSNKREIKIYDEELYNFKNIIPYMSGMKIKAVISTFLQRLSSRSLDDISGGKVTVMGVLETRSVNFDAVIIIDFSDTHVPKRSDKDMFLNTQIREMANLPTMAERENLQKHYYDLLISRSREVAISFVKSSESSESRFLKQLNIRDKNRYSETDYADILFNKSLKHIIEQEDIVLEYSFKGRQISATRLKSFLTCKRQYYYKYIKHIYTHEIPKDMPKEYEIGNNVHNALSNLYSKRNSYTNQKELEHDLNIELDLASGESELDKYLISLQKRRLKKFSFKEIEKFKMGWHVECCERFFETDFAGVTLIGQIDRVDKRENEIEVLDYKTGSYTLYNKNNFTDATDFQLEFYYLLASKLGNVVRCGFYDLKDVKIVDELFLKEKLGVLESNIKDLLNLEEINFTKCENINNCVYCDYKIICQRES
jgi:inactivated superfamily I helicase